jgi:hypothetical protein
MGRILPLAAISFALFAYSLWPGSSSPPLPESPGAPPPRTAEISELNLGHFGLAEIRERLLEWERSAPWLVEVGSFGKTPEGREQLFMRLCGGDASALDAVLLTACIHGNEPLSTSVMMASVHRMLSLYGRDDRITRIMDSRAIYFVPVVSPDSYPHSRGVEGVDPNRNFPTLKSPQRRSVTTVDNLRDFFLEVKPKAVLSGHTYGRVFLVPWGDSRSDNPSLSDYMRVGRRMAELSGYRVIRACELYGRPIYGTEIDWFHRNGAFAMVMEFGTHQRKATDRETSQELDRTFGAILHFLEEAPKVEIER